MREGRALRRMVVGSAVAIAGLAPVAAAGAANVPAGAATPSAATWTLVDYSLHDCLSGSDTSALYGVWISGRWSHKISVGASRLPAYAHVTTSYAPIPPGRSNGDLSLALVHVDFDHLPPIGTYTASEWASEATTSAMQSVSITIEVKDRCGY